MRQLLLTLGLVSLFTPTPALPAPREPDHYIDRREFLGRGRSLIKLPYAIVTRTSDNRDSDEVSLNDVIPEEVSRDEAPVEQDIKSLVKSKFPAFNFETTPRPEEETTSTTSLAESRLRPLDYYYKFISVNLVDGTSRGGDGDNLLTLSCCHEVRMQG